MEQENRLVDQKNYYHHSREELFTKKKTLSTLKISKSLVDTPCSTRTIRRHLNNEKIKHK